MKKITILLLLFLSCVYFAENVSAASKKVAVYVEGEISNSNKSIVSSAILARMSSNKEYIPFERNETFIDALNNEQDFQLSGEVPENEIRKIGNRLGVDFVIAINVIFSDDICYMSARLINLETGEIVKTTNINRKYTSTSVLTALANNVGYRLLNKKSK